MTQRQDSNETAVGASPDGIDGMIAHLSWALHLDEKQAETARSIIASWATGEGSYAFARCESPAERLFLVGLMMCEGVGVYLRNSEESEEWVSECAIAYAENHTLFAQVELEPYRVDFLMANNEVLENPVNGVTSFTRLAIEIDGHDWHERTKEQAGADRARDIELLLVHGVLTIRFTGSQVYADPAGCCRKALAVADAITDRVAAVLQESWNSYLLGKKELEEASNAGDVGVQA